MRFPIRLLAVVFLSLSALASELTIKVIDPQSAAVSGARVEIFQKGSSRPLAVEITSSQGTVSVVDSLPTTGLRVHVLAAGFAEQWSDVDETDTSKMVTIALHIAAAAEAITVSATGTPVPTSQSGATISDLNGSQLETMRPVAASDALRFLPGAVVNTAGERGGLSSLFVRGGDSRYNKVIVDGVSVTEPGGTFDFGTLPLDQADRVEFVRGTESTLYGSDAMTSVVQVWTRTGSASVPELGFGADAGNYGTENGYASLSGAMGRSDYNFFGDQFNSTGSGPNNDNSNSLEGMNVGARLNDSASLRLRVRHDNSVTGVQGGWNFNGDPLLLPDLDQRARQNNLLASLDLTLKTGSQWVHHLTGYEFNLKTSNMDGITDPGRVTPFGEIDTPFQAFVNVNRAGFQYQGDYVERSWAETVIGYEFEDETGSIDDPVPAVFATFAHGLRRNEAAYVEQRITRGRFTATGGVRFVRNTTFGNAGVPRISAAYSLFRGGRLISGTQIRGAYATGIKEPRFEEAFASGPFQVPNPDLKAERNRSLEAGIQQAFVSGRIAFTATYFNNLFHDQIEFVTINPTTFVGQYINLEKSLAHGAEATLEVKLTGSTSWLSGYTYTSTQILNATAGSFPPNAQGDPLLRRPRHSASSLLSYTNRRFGGSLGASFVGRRPDSDFDGFNVDHTPGYVLADAGGWYAIHRRVTAYINVENLLNHSYQEVTGYPGLKINFRAGMRFRLGGD